ncbi:MAG: hypothetical protein AABZ94_01605 [Candidatus Eisenbacteria bacterium]
MNGFLKSTLTGLAVLALLGATGCNDSKDRIITVDAVPFTVDGVYSVTGDLEVTIYWRPNQESDIAYYKVFRNSAPTGSFTLIGTAPGTSFVDNNVVNGNTYFYAVSAVDDAGQESAALSYENVFDTPRPEGIDAVLTNAFTNTTNAGWDFSAYTTRALLDARTDIWYDAQGGSYLIYAPTDTQIQDAGFVTLRDVDFAPPAGWSADGTVEAIVGHSYIVYTRDGHYAKFEVIARGSGTLTMDWAYQIDPDNPELARRLP